MSSTQEIIFTQQNNVAIVTLNRPRALNALTHEMCLALSAQLGIWAEDDTVSLVMVKAVGEKAFCAGGDIVKLYREGTAGGNYPYEFYRDEYICNARVKHFPKPYIALIDGIVMGGGVGVSVHGSHRIATERTLFAMPESGIGLFPDVGGSYFLPRCPGKLGLYLGLTGARLKAADCLYAGIATHYIPTDKLAALESDLINGDYFAPVNQVIEAVLEKHSETLDQAPLMAQQVEIDQHFAAEYMDGIVDSLSQSETEWAAKTLKILQQKSPTSLKITLRQLREGADLDFDACMQMEWRLVNRIIKGHDFTRARGLWSLTRTRIPNGVRSVWTRLRSNRLICILSR